MTKRRTGCCAWGGGMSAVTVLLALTAMAGSAKADPIIYDGFAQVNIYYGVSQLYSPTNVLLSTTVDMTVETEFPYSEQAADGFAALTAYFLPLMDPSIEQMLADNPVPPIPAYITTNLPGFANGNGFGAELDVTDAFILPDPNTSPTPSARALYQALTTEPDPSVVTADSGFVLLGPMFDYVAGWGPFGPVPGSTADTIAGTTLVDIFERDIQLQETSAPVPEPGSLGLLGIVVGLTLWKHLRT
jgi:hypothetical protein